MDKIQDAGLKSTLAITKSDKEPKIGSRAKIMLYCDYCQGPISGKPILLRFAKFERYLCCTICRSAYKEKYGGMIESLARRHNEERRR